MAEATQIALPPIPPNIAAMSCFPDDKKKIRLLVYGMFFLDTLQSVLATADAFHWFAKGFGDMRILSQPYISAFDAPMLDGVIAFVAQSFFCWRIGVLQKSWWLPASVFMVALASLVGAIATGVGTFGLGDLTLLHKLTWQLCLWLGGSALADTLIAIIMTNLLLRSRTQQHQQTDKVLVRIVRLTVETNSVTASVAVVVLICLLAIPDNYGISMAPAYALGKLYSNTLLAVFNNRVYMSSKGMFPRAPNTAASTGIDLAFRHAGASQSTGSSKQLDSQKEPYRIEVFRETETTADELHTKDYDRRSTTTHELSLNDENNSGKQGHIV
ncbi:hypothetical protein H0H81_012689 [Sphagnurus paluster]|uniref:DUF6534 domain-containing protein n=1 Tax=Sphagnurus paluster TaxID=117069 RepID=A0A9P7K219_9AGAR|nr:hypothetical protein H0H81_012689 [Sphagnurus paluster]